MYHIEQNIPGDDFENAFVVRIALANRLAINIKRQRSSVGPVELSKCFNNFREALTTVKPCHIYNYDETNIRDDPSASTKRND